MKLSVSMIVKNEESCLKDCLESVKDADEIVIVDTGSKDKTIEIAKQYTDKVYSGDEYLWRDDFAFHRNQSLNLCTGDWIIIIDADEILEDNGIEKIRKFINELKEDKKAILIKTISSMIEDTYNIQIRIFKNNTYIKWFGPAHNYLNAKENDITEMELFIKYGFSKAHNLDPNRTFRILKNYVKKNPDAVREKYYLGREYYYKRDLNKALKYFGEYVKVSKSPVEITDAYMLGAYCYFNQGEFQGARECCLKAILLNADFKEPFLLMSKLGGSEENNKKWLEFSELCTNKNVLFVREAKFIKTDDETGKIEKDEKYYDAIFKNDYSTTRYEDIFLKIQKLVGDRSVLDIGCGIGTLASYIKNYQGFDFSKQAIYKARKINENVWLGNAYDLENYKNADVYVLTEVLEHLDDLRVLSGIKSGQEIIFSIPSFDDESHLRTYNEKMMKDRYKDLLDIKEVYRFNWENYKWKENKNNKKEFILLVRAIKK
jgi:glycosyltransferase involved in cell wall biosynthesis